MALDTDIFDNNLLNYAQYNSNTENESQTINY